MESLRRRRFPSRKQSVSSKTRTLTCHLRFGFFRNGPAGDTSGSQGINQPPDAILDRLGFASGHDVGVVQAEVFPTAIVIAQVERNAKTLGRCRNLLGLLGF